MNGIGRYSGSACRPVLHRATRAAKLTGHSQAKFLVAIAGREELGLTELSNDIAIPHSTLARLKSVTALFARLA
ncbi:MAG: PTS sugar transporter subunit IIA [Candidatus Devosia symbiotica]|nr:PTS sugar transporter subunit IIA [Candidatus Devosia symbiotica]